MLKHRGRMRLIGLPLNWLRRGVRLRLDGHGLGSRPGAAHESQAADIEELLRLARLSFVAVQAAWDRADLPAMATLATAPLLADLRLQLDARGPLPNHTEVLQLDARLLCWEELREAFVASVEFTGLIRERSEDAAAPFRELWLLARIKSAGRDWKLARVQSLS